MFRKVGLVILTVCIIMAMVSTTNAFDNQRKGFMLGLGFGGGVEMWMQTFSEKTGAGAEAGDLVLAAPPEFPAAFRTDFRIGFGTSETFQLYWMSKVNWFSMDNALGKSVTIANGVGGLGFTYFFRPTDPSPYILGGIGFSSWSAPFESGSEAWYGFGAAGGVGYQFANHLALELSLTFGNPSKTAGGLKFKSYAEGITATINAADLDIREVKKRVKSLSEKLGAPAHGWKVYEMSGARQGQELAFALLGIAGTLSVVGFTMEKLELRLSNLMAFDAEVIGTWGCKPELYAAVLDLVTAGKLKVQPFIQTRPMSLINEVFRQALGHKLVKRCILIPDMGTRD